MSKVSIVFPVFLPSESHKKMTDSNLYIAKTSTKVDAEWVIVETGSSNYLDEADIYIYEKNRTNPNISINRAFHAASGDYVVFLGNDLTVCNKWLEYLIECFEKKGDCGIASLGNNEHGDIHEDSIVEGLYFSVCMMKKEDAWFDPNYTFIFDDTDLVFRLHTQGKKFYKNLKGYANHRPHSTLGSFGGNKEEYERSRQYFIHKYSEYKDDSFYKKLAGV